jgi:hypothetical protein
MDYTPEQRALITRMGELSRRMDETVQRHKREQVSVGQDMVDIGTRLVAAIERMNVVSQQSDETMAIFLAHGDAFREFLDTL